MFAGRCGSRSKAQNRAGVTEPPLSRAGGYLDEAAIAARVIREKWQSPEKGSAIRYAHVVFCLMMLPGNARLSSSLSGDSVRGTYFPAKSSCSTFPFTTREIVTGLMIE